MSRLDRALLVCPTLNPGDMFGAWLKAFNNQKEKPAVAMIIDSSSDDGSVDMAKKSGFTVKVIERTQFNHGGTRQQAVDDSEEFDYVIFLTQDALLCDDHALSLLLSAFDDANVAAVCGRQLPHENAGAIEAHARLFSYPETSNIRSIKDAGRLGLKTAFLSNSFAAYRVSALKEVGGFPDDIIFAEDMYVAAKLLKAGHSIAYAADACVFHSHGYSLMQEVRRYFDMGVFHARQSWIRDELGSAESQGFKFVKSELKFLLARSFWRIPESLLKALLRYMGFRLGLIEKHLPLFMCRRLAMNKVFFKE